MALSPTAADRLAGIFSGFKELGLVERDLHHQVLRETLRANPKYLGVWAVWEPETVPVSSTAFKWLATGPFTDRALRISKRQSKHQQTERTAS